MIFHLQFFLEIITIITVTFKGYYKIYNIFPHNELWITHYFFHDSTTGVFHICGKLCKTIKNALFMLFFYMCKTCGYLHFLNSFPHNPPLFHMFKSFPQIIHILKIVERCGKLKYYLYLSCFLQLLKLWKTFLSTISFWISQHILLQ